MGGPASAVYKLEDLGRAIRAACWRRQDLPRPAGATQRHHAPPAPHHPAQRLPGNLSQEWRSHHLIFATGREQCAQKKSLKINDPKGTEGLSGLTRTRARVTSQTEYPFGPLRVALLAPPDLPYRAREHLLLRGSRIGAVDQAA